MKHEAERLARVALGRLAEPGDPRVASLVAELGAVTLYDHLRSQRDERGLLTDVAARLDGMDPAADLDRATRWGIRYLIPTDEEWPRQVDDLGRVEPVQQRGGPPLGLWVRGPLRLDQLAESVAIVGARSATTYGTQVAADLAAQVGSAGTGVVSGAAFGIDQAAHRGSLAMRAPSVSVLACGVDMAYPAAHRQLLDHLAEVGLVVSELGPGATPTRLRFLARNRLIAALTRGTVVVEAAVRSGALNTANWATRLNRCVLGVPGPVTSATSQGVHQLIRSGAATLVTTGAEVLELVGLAGEHVAPTLRGADRPRDRVSLRDQQVLDALPVARGLAADDVARVAGIGILEVRSALSRLQAVGLVDRDDRGWLLATPARA